MMFVSSKSRMPMNMATKRMMSSLMKNNEFTHRALASQSLAGSFYYQGRQQYQQRQMNNNDVFPMTKSTIRIQNFSSVPVEDTDDEEYMNYYQPMGDLFESKRGKIGENMVGKTAYIRRVFGPGSNARGLLTCGGEELARHASFDPNYNRARGWIQNRAIGPAVLSPVIISGLVGALVEAALPQSVPVSSSMHQVRPLIVGAEVCAKIEVMAVTQYKVAPTTTATSAATKDYSFNHRDGFDIQLNTSVIRSQDDAIIAEGLHSVWIPSYLTM